MDLNLLVALDALLAEGSVLGAARRMNLSAPAMSRTLGRIRDAIGDPVFVRAGRKLVPTPRALELRAQVRDVVKDAKMLLRPAGEVSPSMLDRAFTLRTSDFIAGVFGARICAAILNRAPNISLRFTAQGKEDVNALREGHLDLDIGVIGDTGPEIRIQTLFRERFVGVVRKDHPLAKGRMSTKRFASAVHVGASRRGRTYGPIDDALKALGLSRKVAFVVPDFYAALLAAADSDFVASLPRQVALGAYRLGLAVHVFDLPVSVPSIAISQAWHPRYDADAGHRWLRQTVRSAIVEAQTTHPAQAR